MTIGNKTYYCGDCSVLAKKIILFASAKLFNNHLFFHHPSILKQSEKPTSLFDQKEVTTQYELYELTEFTKETNFYCDKCKSVDILEIPESAAINYFCKNCHNIWGDEYETNY